MGVGPTGGQGAGSKVHVSTESVAWRTVSCWGGGEVLEIAKGRIMSYLSFRVKGPTTTTTTTADATLLRLLTTVSVLVLGLAVVVSR